MRNPGVSPELSELAAAEKLPVSVILWVASAWLLTEKHFRKIDGHKDLWALATILGRESLPQSSKEQVA